MVSVKAVFVLWIVLWIFCGYLQIQKVLIQQHEQQGKARALPAVKPAFKKPVANAKKRMCSLLRCHQHLQRKLRVLWIFAVALSGSLSQRPRHPSF